MNYMNKTLYSLTLASLLALSACSSEDVLKGGSSKLKGDPFTLTLTLDRGQSLTRTTLEENEQAGLISKWASGDQIFVYDADGNEAGVLVLDEESIGETKGVFSGTCTGVTGNYTLMYFDAENACFGHGGEEHANASQVLTFNNANHPYCSTIEELSSMELLTTQNPDEYEPVEIIVKDGVGSVAKDIVLDAKLAMARFSLSNIVEETTGTLNIYDADNEEGYTLTYMEYAKKNSTQHYFSKNPDGITISGVDPTKDVFVAFIPGDYRLGFKFTTDKGKVYEATFGSTTTLRRGLYYNAGLDGENNVKGSVVNFSPVAPAYEIKFMKYPEGSQNNEEFICTLDFTDLSAVTLPDNPDTTNTQDFLGWKKAGETATVISGTWDLTSEDATSIILYPVYAAPVEDDDLVGPVFQIGTKKFRFTRANLQFNTNTKEYLIPEKQTDYTVTSGHRIGWTNITTGNPEYIGLFRWGATGIEDDVWKPWPADYWCDVAYYKSAALIHGTLPCQTSANNATISTNKTLCPNGVAQDTPYDWGKAYSKQKGDKDHYFTLTSKEVISVIDHTISICGTVDNIEGLVILPFENIDDAKAAVTAVGAKSDNMYKLPKVLANDGTNYGSSDRSKFAWSHLKLTYAQLTALNAIFLPAAGMNNPSTDSKKLVSSDYTGKCYYWTSTPTTTPNAIHLFVNGESTVANRVFKVYGFGKGYGLSVRLVKEIKEGTTIDDTVGLIVAD